MNNLSLVQNLSVECGASNVNVMTTVGATGEALRFVNWIARAWNELQTKHDTWQWMRSSVLLGGGVSFAPLAGAYNAPLGTGIGTVGLAVADFGGRWAQDSFRNFTTTVGFQDEVFMTPIDFDWWRDGYMYGAQRLTRTRPVVLAIGSDKSLCFGPPSNGLYTITGDYYRAPNIMSGDAATPTGLPDKYHLAIMYKAMTYYGTYDAAPEVSARGESGYDELVRELETLYGPQVTMGAPLA